MRRSIIALLLASLTTPSDAKFPDNFDQALESIAFGSCNRDELPQPLWPVIAENKPDLWIWAGDNIYADWYEPPNGPKKRYRVNREWVTERYAAQFNHPAYATFRKETNILGTWDDHDYGRNNAGATYKNKEITRDLALSFMEVPIGDPRWTRPGLYGAYDFGPAGKRTKIVLLDNRYFATSPKADEPDLLGPEQRAWLEATLRFSDADLHILVSGTQFLAKDHHWEKWANFPETRQWLLDLIAEESMPMTILVSGDRHIHEISVIEDGFGYPLADITSSGLTHFWDTFPGEENSLRHGAVYTGLGFGTLQIDWSGVSPSVTLELRDESNEVVNQFTVARP